MLCDLVKLCINYTSKVLIIAEKSKPDPFEFSIKSL